MTRLVTPGLWLFAGLNLALAVWMAADPRSFYDTLADFGPKAAPAVPALRALEREASGDLRTQARLALARIRPEYVAYDSDEPPDEARR